MTNINPFTGAILQAPQVQRQQAVDQDRHLRRVADRSRHAALTTDRLEHQVESAEELHAVRDEQEREQPKRQPKQKRPPSTPDDASESHLDVTA